MIKCLIYISLHKIISSFIKLPFFTFHSSPSNNISESDYSKFFSENNIYTYLIIGSPPQKIVSKINFNEYSFNIYNNRCDIPSNYNSENPKSNTKKDLGFLLTDVYVDTFLTEDLFLLPETKNNTYTMSYIYAPMNNNEFEMSLPKDPYTCANIGLKLSSDQMQAFKYNFLRELKALGIIDNYVFYIEYNDTNKEKGNLIIGKKPHELNDKYKSNQFKQIYAINMKIELYWMIRFDSIYFNQNNENNFLKNYNLSKNNDAIIENNLNVIFGTYEYMELIEKKFFEEKIKKNLCTKNYLLNNLINYECKSFEDIQNFPNLYFEHKNFFYIFEINYKDIFVKYNDKFICQIWFDLKKNDTWRLGKPFLKKYLFIFDLDRKSIGFYNPKTIDEDNENKVKNDNNNFRIIYILIIVFILSCIAFYLCYLLAKTIYRNKNIFNDKKLTELINLNEESLY